MDLSPGIRIGRLTVEAEVATRRWRCRCDCGTVKVIRKDHLIEQRTRSCGCLRHDLTIQRLLKHGATYTPEYNSWSKAKSRCHTPTNRKYHLYGARGIKMAAEWRTSFERFLSDVGRRPGPEYSLDRIDVNGDYAPGNVRWATPREQANNTRFNHVVAHKGEPNTIAEWARTTGVKPATISRRIAHLGWNEADAVSVHTRETHRRFPSDSILCPTCDVVGGIYKTIKRGDGIKRYRRCGACGFAWTCLTDH